MIYSGDDISDECFYEKWFSEKCSETSTGTEYRYFSNDVDWSGCRDYIAPLLAYLHRLPIRLQAQFKIYILTFKALYALGPIYLKVYLLVCEALPHHHYDHLQWPCFRYPAFRDQVGGNPR